MSFTALRCIDWSALDEAAQPVALARPAVSGNPDIGRQAMALLAEVRAGGDEAVLRLTERFDGVRPEPLRVTTAEAAAAERELPAVAREAIAVAIANVRRFHEAQLPPPVRVETAPGVVCERVSRPLRAVGLYVPAGSAPLPSTAIMLSVPATLAGCATRIICTPPRPDGRADASVVVAARMAGVSEIFKIGGVQAVGAMAYGTASVPKVDKIFGPGNAWVTAAKAAVAADPGGAALDLPAGPSEVMVIADDEANPRYVALDLLSQAEHGPDSHAVLVTTSTSLVGRVDAALREALPRLSRRSIIERSLAHAVAILVPDAQTAVAVANSYAPEHLILQVADARALAAAIDSAGSVFIGPWTPESVGDYCSGTNHVLPTYGYARAYSGLSVTDFQRRMTLQELTPAGLRLLAPTVTTLAGLEGLDAHASAVAVRMADISGA
jgi:histidinol dehydrogenase